jgi:REP element-mobilizing transposase RayT
MQPDNRHRRSIRLSGYDYGQSNTYFVTIVAGQRQCLFGEIRDGDVRLYVAGQIVREEWLKTARLRPCVRIDEFVVMPNHFHGILAVLKENEGMARHEVMARHRGMARHEEGMARHAPTVREFGRPAAASLASIIGAFKSAVARRINSSKATPGAPVWQRNLYEHVIRDETSLNRIREYIINNPPNWEMDRENPGRKGEDRFYRWLASFKDRPKKP